MPGFRELGCRRLGTAHDLLPLLEGGLVCLQVGCVFYYVGEVDLVSAGAALIGVLAPVITSEARGWGGQ